MKICVVGDLHLDAQINGYDYHEDIKDSLYKIDISDVELIIQLGDLCDCSLGPKTTRALNTFAKWVDRQQTYIIPGNHCLFDDKRAMSVLDVYKTHRNISVFDEISTYPLNGIYSALFLPWLSRAHGSTDVLQLARQAMDRLPKNERFIAFCHLDIAAATPGSEREMPRLGQLFLPQELIEDERIVKIFGGHLHEAQIIGKIEIVGSLQCLGFGERDHQKGYITIDL